MTQPITKLLEHMARINDARAKATQGEWFSTHGDKYWAYAMISDSKGLMFIAEELRSEPDSDFIALAANEIARLTKTVEVLAEALEKINIGTGQTSWTDQLLSSEAISRAAAMWEGNRYEQR